MGMKSPSKFLKISFLEMLVENDYCNKDKGVDYAPCEVDTLLYAKQRRKDEEHERKCLLGVSRHEDFLMRKKQEKDCTKCKEVKGYGKFDIDKSKSTNRRSWCKECRRIFEREGCPF